MKKYFEKVVMDNDDFQLVHIDSINICDQPYTKYEVKTVKGSDCDDLVVSIDIDSFGRERDGSVVYEPRSVRVKWGLNSQVNSTKKMINCLEKALDFANKVATHLGVEVANL